MLELDEEVPVQELLEDELEVWETELELAEVEEVDVVEIEDELETVLDDEDPAAGNSSQPNPPG